MLDWHPVFFSEFQRLSSRLTYPRRYATGATKTHGRWITFSDPHELPLTFNVYCRVCGWIHKVSIPNLRYRYNTGEQEGQICVVVRGLPVGDKCPGGCGQESSRVLDSILSRLSIKRVFASLVTELSRLYYGCKENKNELNKGLHRTPSHPNLKLAPIQERVSTSLPTAAVEKPSPSQGKRRMTLVPTGRGMKKSGSEKDLRKRMSLGGTSDTPRKIKWRLLFENSSGVRTPFLAGIYSKAEPLYCAEKKKDEPDSKPDMEIITDESSDDNEASNLILVRPKIPSSVTLRRRNTAAFLQYREPPPMVATPQPGCYSPASPASMDESLVIASPVSTVDDEFWLVDNREKKCRRRWKSAGGDCQNNDGTMYKTALDMSFDDTDEEEEEHFEDSASPEKNDNSVIQEIQSKSFDRNANPVTPKTALSGSECDIDCKSECFRHTKRRKICLHEEETDSEQDENVGLFSEIGGLFMSTRRGLRGEEKGSKDVLLAKLVIGYCMVVGSLMLILLGREIFGLAMEFFSE